MARHLYTICGLALVLAAFATPLAAHHSFGAEYDANQPITLTGVLTRIEWTNPHSFFYMDVSDKDAVIPLSKFHMNGDKLTINMTKDELNGLEKWQKGKYEDVKSAGSLAELSH